MAPCHNLVFRIKLWTTRKSNIETNSFWTLTSTCSTADIIIYSDVYINKFKEVVCGTFIFHIVTYLLKSNRSEVFKTCTVLLPNSCLQIIGGNCLKPGQCCVSVEDRGPPSIRRSGWPWAVWTSCWHSCEALADCKALNGTLFTEAIKRANPSRQAMHEIPHRYINAWSTN